MDPGSYDRRQQLHSARSGGKRKTKRTSKLSQSQPNANKPSPPVLSPSSSSFNPSPYSTNSLALSRLPRPPASVASAYSASYNAPVGSQRSVLDPSSSSDSDTGRRPGRASKLDGGRVNQRKLMMGRFHGLHSGLLPNSSSSSSSSSDAESDDQLSSGPPSPRARSVSRLHEVQSEMSFAELSSSSSDSSSSDMYVYGASWHDFSMVNRFDAKKPSSAPDLDIDAPARDDEQVDGSSWAGLFRPYQLTRFLLQLSLAISFAYLMAAAGDVSYRYQRNGMAVWDHLLVPEDTFPDPGFDGQFPFSEPAQFLALAQNMAGLFYSGSGVDRFVYDGPKLACTVTRSSPYTDPSETDADDAEIQRDGASLLPAPALHKTGFPSLSAALHAATLAPARSSPSRRRRRSPHRRPLPSRPSLAHAHALKAAQSPEHAVNDTNTSASSALIASRVRQALPAVARGLPGVDAASHAVAGLAWSTARAVDAAIGLATVIPGFGTSTSASATPATSTSTTALAASPSAPLLGAYETTFTLSPTDLGPFDYAATNPHRFVAWLQDTNITSLRLHSTLSHMLFTTERLCVRWDVGVVVQYDRGANHWRGDVDAQDCICDNPALTPSAIVHHTSMLLLITVLSLLLLATYLVKYAHVLLSHAKRMHNAWKISHLERSLGDLLATYQKIDLRQGLATHSHPHDAALLDTRGQILVYACIPTGHAVLTELTALRDRWQRRTQLEATLALPQSRLRPWWFGFALCFVLTNVAVYSIALTHDVLRVDASLDAVTLLFSLAAASSAILLMPSISHFPDAYTIFLMAFNRALPFIARILVGVSPVFVGYAASGTILFNAVPRFASLDLSFMNLFAVMKGDNVLDMFTDAYMMSTSTTSRILSRVFLYSFSLIFLVIIYKLSLAAVSYLLFNDDDEEDATKTHKPDARPSRSEVRAAQSRRVLEGLVFVDQHDRLIHADRTHTHQPNPAHAPATHSINSSPVTLGRTLPLHTGPTPRPGSAMRSPAAGLRAYPHLTESDSDSDDPGPGPAPRRVTFTRSSAGVRDGRGSEGSDR